MFHLLIAFIGLHLILAVPQDIDKIHKQPARNASEYQYQVLISEINERPKCGGALVGEGFVLTSATCVLEFGGIRKFLEEALLHGGGTSLLFDLGNVTDAVLHPNFMMNSAIFDLAIIKFVPEGKGKLLEPSLLNGTWGANDSCIMSSWWVEEDVWPERLMLQAVFPAECSPSELNRFCFTEETVVFNKSDYGSPIVCSGILTGMVPKDGGKKAINITSVYDWIINTMAESAKYSEPSAPTTNNETKQYLIEILKKLDLLSRDNVSDTDKELDGFTKWNNQIVVPLNHVLFAMVIFLFVLLFFIILFTIVLVYYSRK